MTWNPELYLKFGAERTRAAVDLASRVLLENPARIVDLGCGPGNSTAILQARWPQAEIVGLDSDPAMLATARAAYPRLRWEQSDAAVWTAAASYDLVFANAVLQWLPEQTQVLQRWMRAVRPGGVLAFQIPCASEDSPINRQISELAEEPRWNRWLRSVSRLPVSHEPAFYYEVLSPEAATIDLWTTEYCHVMESPTAILNWIRSTRLRPYLEALPTEAERTEFEAALLSRIAASYVPQADGRILFPFRRLFCAALSR